MARTESFCAASVNIVGRRVGVASLVRAPSGIVQHGTVAFAHDARPDLLAESLPLALAASGTSSHDDAATREPSLGPVLALLNLKAWGRWDSTPYMVDVEQHAAVYALVRWKRSRNRRGKEPDGFVRLPRTTSAMALAERALAEATSARTPQSMVGAETALPCPTSALLEIGALSWLASQAVALRALAIHIGRAPRGVVVRSSAGGLCVQHEGCALEVGGLSYPYDTDPTGALLEVLDVILDDAGVDERAYLQHAGTSEQTIHLVTPAGRAAHDLTAAPVDRLSGR